MADKLIDEYKTQQDMKELMYYARQAITEHIEEYAAAFAKKTNLNPDEIVMYVQYTLDGVKIWFEKK